MIMGQPQTGASVPGVPGTGAAPASLTYTDPARTSREQQDRLKRLRSWSGQNGAPQTQPNQMPNPQLTFSAARPPVAPTFGAPVPTPIQNLPFNAANPRGY
jgi:hypothetical protein